MGQAIYKVVPFESGWGVSHDGRVAGPYLSKEAAFEAAAATIALAVRQGHEITLTVPGSAGQEPALGVPDTQNSAA
jgi:hypothetical protein